MKLFEYFKNFKAILSGSYISISDELDENKGELLKEITFEVKAKKDDLHVFPNGIIPWISLESPEDELTRLRKKSEVVLNYNSIHVVVNYPLKKPKVFEIKNSRIVRSDLINEISKIYHTVYQEEEETSSIKTIPEIERSKLKNRNETNGKYGIWGHDLRDLDLSSVNVVKKNNGRIYLYLYIES
ncbi:hypothetical protein GQF01_14160 [Paenibacillus sp. 5J-6]|uniref:Uncharacterized protein n=1 Tax=Paenibacillus silvestris TaxID=2606219 RepID=A0A6L8UYW6_9BACL|nr:hypothetical protein [Paenibacillus silvestris]MZQ83255.1 hypothetical protein [Paenibacillus silvestris]